MPASAHGIILRLRKFSDTSLIVSWLTLEHGRLSTIARGARRPKSPFRGQLDLFHRCEFTFDPSRRSTLHGLREVEVRGTHPGLREDLSALQQAAYAVALIELLTEPEVPIPEIHSALDAFLADTSSGRGSLARLLAFESTLLEIEGLREIGIKPAGVLDASVLGSLAADLGRAWVSHCGRVPSQRAGLLAQLGVGGVPPDSRA